MATKSNRLLQAYNTENNNRHSVREDRSANYKNSSCRCVIAFRSLRRLRCHERDGHAAEPRIGGFD